MKERNIKWGIHYSYFLGYVGYEALFRMSLCKWEKLNPSLIGRFLKLPFPFPRSLRLNVK
jgi:hypothetical protein